MARKILRTLEELFAMFTVENMFVLEVSVDIGALLVLVVAEGTPPDLALDLISCRHGQ